MSQNILKILITGLRLRRILKHRFVKFFGHLREVWWCSLGVNVGAETDGKNGARIWI
jgi:hypothetical protein